MTSKVTMPHKLFQVLQQGTSAILATQGADGWPHMVLTWAATPDPGLIRFGADLGSTTLANIEREGKAALQIIAGQNVLFLVKGTTRVIKQRLESAPFPVAMVELTLQELKDQSWPGVTVSPITYQWTGPRAEEMARAEQAVLAELRDWKP